MFFLVCSLLFLVACSSKIENPAAINERVNPTTEINEGTDPITEVENLSLVVRSVQDLQLAIEDSVTGKISDIKVDPAIDLASIDNFYVPTVKFDNLQLFQIEVLENYIIYYYIPDDVMEGSQPVFDYNTGITVTFSRKPDKNDPLAPLVKQAGIPLTEDNILYEKNLNSVTFAVGDTWMSIRVPDELNDYNYLKNLGLAEKVDAIKNKSY